MSATIVAAGLPLHGTIGFSFGQRAAHDSLGTCFGHPHHYTVPLAVGGEGHRENPEIAVGYYRRLAGEALEQLLAQALFTDRFFPEHGAPAGLHGCAADQMMRYYDPHHGPVRNTVLIGGRGEFPCQFRCVRQHQARAVHQIDAGGPRGVLRGLPGFLDDALGYPFEQGHGQSLAGLAVSTGTARYRSLADAFVLRQQAAGLAEHHLLDRLG